MALVQSFLNNTLIQELELRKPITTIGRNSNNDIHVNYSAVSGVHARIIQENNQFIIEDNNSTNGTYVNGKRVTRQILTDKDIITTCKKHQLNFIMDASSISKDSFSFSSPPSTNVESQSNLEIPDEGSTMLFDPAKMGELLHDQKLEAELHKGEKFAWVLVSGGNMTNEHFQLSQSDLKIGKAADAHISTYTWFSWFEPKISAVIHYQNNGYFIIPKRGVKSKVEVNRKLIKEATKLSNADHIKIRNVELTFYISVKPYENVI